MKKVLIVDDDKDERTVLTDILSAEGFDTVAAEDGLMALKILEKQPVGLIITDRAMPQMDGMALLEKVREQKSTIPVIVVRAYGEEELWGEAIGLGAKDYLVKP